MRTIGGDNNGAVCLWSSSVAVCRPLLDKVQRDESVLRDKNISGELGRAGERGGHSAAAHPRRGQLWRHVWFGLKGQDAVGELFTGHF